MIKDFLIIPPEKIELHHMNIVLDKFMKNIKIKVSRKNYILIGTESKIILDINSKAIKGRLFTGASDKEEEIVKKILTYMGEDKVYIHYYGNTPFTGCKKIKVV